MPRLSQRSVIVMLVLLCVATRIPQLVSPRLLLDGDECVVAIMAKHLLSGKDLSFYFYGQQYGFSFIECLFITPFYLVFGVTAVAVKLGMLALWTVGVLLLYRLLRLINTGNNLYPLLLILLFICTPAWAVWSMKARGGYLTAFTASSALLCILFAGRKNIWHYLAISVLFVLVYESQRIWLPGLVPFILYGLVKDRKASHFVVFALPAIVLLTLLHFYKHTLPDYGEMPMYFPTSQDIMPRLQRLPFFLYSSLHGNYYFDDLQKPNLFCALFAVVQALTIVAILLIAVYNVATRRKGWGLFNCAALSLLLSLGVTMLSMSRHGRYLLPVTGFTMISLALLLDHMKPNIKLVRLSLGTMAVIGLIAVVTFYDFDFITFRERDLSKTLQHLEDKGIKYVYCSDNMFTWQIMFYSNERIIAREKRPPGRYPEYQRMVDSAYKRGAPTAYMAYPAYSGTTIFPAATYVNDFYVVENPPVETIANEFKSGQ